MRAPNACFTLIAGRWHREKRITQKHGGETHCGIEVRGTHDDRERVRKNDIPRDPTAYSILCSRCWSGLMDELRRFM